MSFANNYLALRAKRLKDQQQKKEDPMPNLDSPFKLNTLALKSPSEMEELAPVTLPYSGEAPVMELAKEEERKWFEAGAFDDGYDFGDVTKTILGSGVDLVENVASGVLGMGEKVVDAGATLVGNLLPGSPRQMKTEKEKIEDSFKAALKAGSYEAFLEEYENQDPLGDYKKERAKFKQDVSDFVAKDLYDEEKIAKTIISNPFKALTTVDAEKDSVFGEKLDSLAQSGGQLAATAALQAVGVPWWLTTGATSFGAEAENALRQGASLEEAALSATVSAGAEILTEKISGGISFGGKTLDDSLTGALARGISNKVVRTLAKFGLDAAGEGGEEILSGVMSAIGQKMTYEKDKDLFGDNGLFSSEDAFESFIGGAVLGGGASGINVVNSAAKGVDAVTGLKTDTEQKVVDKLYNDAIAEAEADGKKLTQKEKQKLYDSVMNDLDKGYISTDTIEEILGGEDYKAYKDTIDNEDSLIKELDELRNMKSGDMTDIQRDRLTELKGMNLTDTTKRDGLKSKLGESVFGLVKDTRLAESYNERTRRSQAFEADLSKYDEKQAAVVQKAIDSGILNNTNRTHDFVDMVSKISADKGVLFDFANNAKLKESGFAIDGATINGFVTKDGVTLNIDSAKSLNSVVGHEITHVLEGTELYAEMQKALFDYAKSKNDYQGRYDSLSALYKGVEGANVDAELTADLVGDYLFTDRDFIHNLSTKHRNVFKKIFDEIKYLYKMATAGSKEARELEKVKRAFEKAYKENGKGVEGTSYSLSDSDGKALTNEQNEYFKDSKVRDENGNLKVMYHGSQDAGFHIFDPTMSDDGISLFFVDRNEVAASYSGTSETYEAKTIKTIDDFNKFAESIDVEGYEVAEKDGKFTLLYEGDKVATRDTMQEIYEEFCWYEGVGEGDANYKVYLNLTNPLEIDAKGRPWNKIDAEFSQEVYDKYNSLTAEEKEALTDLAEWEDFSLFNSEIQEARGDALASAYAKMGEDCNIYDLFSVAADSFSEDSMRENARKYLKTRDYAQRAKEQGYDGVIFKNVVDNGGYSSGDEGASTVAIAFSSEQVKSVANEKPTGDKDIRYSLSEYTAEEKKAHNKAVVEHFGKTYSWAETGYLLLDGTRLDLSGKHDGAPGGYRTVDHRDITEALGYDYGGGDYSGSLIQFMSEGNIRIIPECNGINLSVKPTEAQEQALSSFISRYRGEVMLDIDDLKGNTVVSVEYPRGTYYTKVLNDIREWFDNGIKPENSSGYSLTKEGSAPKQYGRYNVRGEDVALAPTKGQVAPAEDTAANVAPEIDKAVAPTVDEAVAPVTEEEANAMQGEILNSLTDADAPPEVEAPYYESEAVTPNDPFEDRNIKEVGNKAVKAYMYENPEVKPFFQEEANIMLGELRDTVKGERYYTETPDGNADAQYGAESYGFWTGTSRQTSSDIAYLLDTVKMSYADIEKGLNAIIEDNGAENIAAAKKIEFILNDRLLKGYQTMDGYDIPANQDYINLLNEKQIIEYNEEARKNFFEVADEFAPPAPEGETSEVTESENIAPLAENIQGDTAHLSIKPPKESNNEPRMKRADSTSNAPDGMEERSWYETSTGSEAVDNMVTPDDIPDDVRYYQVKSNKKTLEAANRRLEKDGYAKSREYFEGRMSERKLSVEDIALGERLIQEAAKAGDAKAVQDLIIDVSIIGTELGQRVQALSLIRRLTPEGQLKALQRTVNRGKAKGDKAFNGVEITQEMIDYILKTYGTDGTYIQSELDAAVEVVKQQIADQMELTAWDKINAWRYLSMLGNPKTHIRNIFSNVAMFGTRAVKNAVARTVEDVALRNKKPTLNTEAPKAEKPIAPMRQVMPAGTRVKAADRDNIGTIQSFNPQTGKYTVYFENKRGQNATVKLDANILKPLKPIKKQNSGKVADGNADGGEGDIAPVHYRTKTWARSTDAVKAFAKQTTKDMESAIKGDTKYSEEGSIKSKRQMFKTKPLNAVNNFNQDKLEGEDYFFSRPAFEFTFREYLTANGIKTEADIKNNPELIEKAKDYALEEARRATFRQDSYLADKIKEIENKNPALGVAVGSVIPFKKTPINVAKTGAAYSPLGFARNVYDAVKVAKGEMDASEAIDHLAQTLTGTSLTLIGFALASMGALNGAGSDDKEGKYDYQLGKQSYSFNFGGDTYSLSWLSPVAMPLFVGANAYETLVEQKEWDANVVVDTLAQTLDPLSEMSFLSSLDDVLSSYDSGVDKIWGAGESMLQNYATQFIPTLSSQIASTFDDTKRSTKPSRNSGFKFGEETVNKIMYKVPGLRNLLEPTTDIWGNEAKQNENVFLRGLESFLSPANKREGILTAVDEEIKSLYGETGDAGVLPSIPDSYINYDGEKYDMSAEEYTAYKQTYGQTALDLMEKLFDTETYKNATSEERADMVGRVYDYARDNAKKEYFDGIDLDFTNATKDNVEYYKENSIVGAIEADLPVDEYEFSTEYPEKYKFFKNNGISYQTYKAADEDGKRAYSWAYENPGKYTMSKAISDDFLTYYQYKSELYDLKADKDEDGKSISGSKKEKVIEYINNMDLDYGQKIILFRSMYDSKEDRDNYNRDIIDYLNNRDDISYEEMETILKELGFTVDSSGNISWD